jgi:hypothetical protein
MHDTGMLPTRWELAERGLRERMYRASSPRERERWHALWRLSRDYVVDANQSQSRMATMVSIAR